MVIKTINIDEHQVNYLKDRKIKLSPYIRGKIAEDMNKQDGIEPTAEPKEVNEDDTARNGNNDGHSSDATHD